MAKEEIKGHIAAITTNVIFGLNIPATKSLLSGWMSPMGYTVTRMLFGMTAFWIIGFFRKREKVSLKDLMMIFLCGLLGLVATQVTFAVGLRYTTPVTYSLILALTPIVVLLLSALFLKEPVTYYKTIGVLLGLSGSSIIILQGSSNNSSNTAFGILTAIVSVSCYAGYIILTRKISAKYSPVTMMKWMFLLSAVVLFPFGCSELPEQRIYSSSATFTAISELIFALLFSSIIAFFLMPVALKRIKATTAAIYANAQPLVASSAAIIVGQDFFGWDRLLALILVITGVYLVTQSNKTGKSYLCRKKLQ
ncbi:MAG: DMT family transporter [Prevotellaceae bacterium]|jgi:drug/metabolite transporter (DMT)-like permease|nr:DMT family transporter [Prevotellaceae bacterium]